MRTILNLDDDVLQAARALSRRRGKPIGVVISELIRRGLGPSQRRLLDLDTPTARGAFRASVGTRCCATCNKLLQCLVNFDLIARSLRSKERNRIRIETDCC